MKGMLKRAVLFAVSLSVSVQIFTMHGALAEYDVSYSSVNISYSEGSFNSSGILAGTLANAVMAAAAYNASDDLIGVDVNNSITFSDGTAPFSFAVTAPIASKFKMFVWDNFTDCNPLSDVYTPFQLTATRKANGVSLDWEAVGGYSSYDVYKDGVRIDTVTETEYNDIYFNTIEEMPASPAEHTYYVTAGGIQSRSISATADTSLIKYITFDNAVYNTTQKVAGLNVGAHGISMAETDGTGVDVSLYTVRARTDSDSEVYTSKYISTQTYRRWSEAFVGNIDGQNALGQVMYQYRKYVNGVLTLDSNQCTRPVLVIDGFTDTDDYTFIMTADLKVANYVLPATWKAGDSDFVNRGVSNNKISVVGGENITVNSSGQFATGTHKDTYETYVYEMNTNFNGGGWGDMRFQGTVTGQDETAGIRSFGVVKSSDFIKEKTIETVSVNATRKANGVILNWGTVAGVSSYDVYRDGSKIATVTEPAYSDKLFETIEAIPDHTSHTYYIAANGRQSSPISATADTSLIKYIIFDNAAYSEAGINTGAHGISVATENTNGGKLSNYTVKVRTDGDPAMYTSKYWYTLTYRAYNEAFIGTIDGQNALGQVMYQINKNGNNFTTDVTRPILDVDGFNTTDNYTIIMNADIKISSYEIPRVETSGGDAFSYRTVSNSRVSVVGGENITVNGSYQFNPGSHKDNYTTYIYEMNTAFNGAYGDIRFHLTSSSVDETAGIRSFGIVKSSDFMR